jgi:hypothetical protein
MLLFSMALFVRAELIMTLFERHPGAMRPALG